MLEFVKSLGLVCGVPLFLCFEVTLFASLFLSIYVLINYRKVKKGQSTGEGVSEESLFFKTHDKVPWSAMRMLDVAAAISTSLGLFGTVLGLYQLLMDVNFSSNVTNKISVIVKSYGLALSTTVAGLTIAIIATLVLSLVKTKFLLIALEVSKNVEQ